MTTTTAVNDRIGRTLLSLLGATGMTKTQVMQALDMSPQTMGRRLRGDNDWTAVEVATLSALFGVDVAMFYEGPEGRLGVRPRPTGPSPDDRRQEQVHTPLRRRRADLGSRRQLGCTDWSELLAAA